MRREYDYSKLKGRITEKFGTQGAFGKFLGKDDCYVSSYLTGKRKFSQATIQIWVNALDIAPCDIGLYFFTLKVDT